jgi:hypothetical protein
MNAPKKSTLAATIFAILSVVALSGCNGETAPTTPKYDALAKCLTAKGAIFYGAYWCPHCQDQKKQFGESLKYINYVECDPKGENANPDACQKAGVERYPTWFFPGQGTVPGVETPEELSQKANCEDTLTGQILPGQEATQQSAQTPPVQSQPTP